MNYNSNEIVALAPGRTCLFGDHQDYLELPIIACAINRYIKVVGVKNNSDSFNINQPDIYKKRIIKINSYSGEVDSNDHLLSALKVLGRYGCRVTEGYDITISGNLPINAGISSSSAVVLAWVRFLLEAFGANREITPAFVSKISYEAEVLEHGSPGGKMDQYSIGLGNILYLETDDTSNYEIIERSLNGLIIGESGIPKKTIGVLKELKEKSWLAILKVKESIKDFDIHKAKRKDLDMLLNYLPDKLQPYLYAAISNHDITQRALKELKKEHLDYRKIGSLMNEHHQILRDVLKITVPRIDDMIDAALDAGAFGAKIVGSGRGGSIVAIAPKDKEQNVVDSIKAAGGKKAYAVSVDAGARILNNNDHYNLH